MCGDQVDEICVAFAVEEVEVVPQSEFADGVESVPVIPVFNVRLFAGRGETFHVFEVLSSARSDEFFHRHQRL